MKRAVAAVFVVLITASCVSNPVQVTDPMAIQAFLSDPNTHTYKLRDPAKWKSSRKVLRLGSRQPDGSCRYGWRTSAPGNQGSSEIEVAGNTASCKLLVLESNQGSRPVGGPAPRRSIAHAPAPIAPGVTVASLAAGKTEVTDPRAIQIFLADPLTYAYNVKDPTTWTSYRKILQIGIKQPDGSCRYALGIATPGNYVSFATEIAVNKARCQSLVLEGNPGGGPTREPYGSQGADRKLAGTGLDRNSLSNPRTRLNSGAPGSTPGPSTVSYVSTNLEVTDPKAIQAFLAEPQTHVYNIKDPTTWLSFRKVLQIGTKQADGSCKYAMGISTPGDYVSFATEIAVNKTHCESLVLEGNPGGGPAKPVQRPPSRNLKSVSNTPPGVKSWASAQNLSRGELLQSSSPQPD